MPSIASIVRRVFQHQDLLYWEKTGSDPFGKPVYAAPIPLTCRAEDKVQEIVTTEGRKVWIKGYLLMTDKIVVGSLVFLGTEADWKALPTYPAIPTVNQGGREIILVNTTPDIKAQSEIFEVFL